VLTAHLPRVLTLHRLCKAIFRKSAQVPTFSIEHASNPCNVRYMLKITFYSRTQPENQRNMQKLIPVIVLLACLPAHADRMADIYKEGLIAVDQSNVKAAELAFREVLRLQPNHPHARFQLGELQRNQGSVAARARQRKMAEFQIDQVNFDKVELSDALE